MKPTIPVQKPRQPIRASTLETFRQFATWVAGMRADPPLELKHTPGGPLVRLMGDIIAFELGYLASGTIPARTGTLPNLTFGSNNAVTILRINNALTGTITAGYTRKVYNSWATAVPASKLILIARVLGIRLALQWDC